MPKPNIDDLTSDETIELFKECMDVLSFDQQWEALMEIWNDDDKEEAGTRLDEVLEAIQEDC